MEEYSKAYRQKVKCPKCGGEVEFNDTIDTNSCDDGTYIDTNTGTCLECGASCLWEDYFTFSERVFLPTEE